MDDAVTKRTALSVAKTSVDGKNCSRRAEGADEEKGGEGEVVAAARFGRA